LRKKNTLTKKETLVEKILDVIEMRIKAVILTNQSATINHAMAIEEQNVKKVDLKARMSM
jgi:hypothetical protein